MERAIHIARSYKPLLTKAQTRYTIITGGRASGKSYAAALAILLRTLDDDNTILFTRYTLINAETSIIPEFMEKIDLLGYSGMFQKRGNDIMNICTGGTILFRGLKTSSGINTASLKSIPKLKMWVNDESEELIDEGVFDTIDLSIRQKDAQCEIWLILNPKDINHFIYRRFFKGNGVDDVCNNRVGDIRYIHTSYLDNYGNLEQKYLDLANRCRDADEERYNSIWLGRWSRRTEGLIYNNWQQESEDDYPTSLPSWYGVDWGFSNDPAAVVRICFDRETYTLHLKEVLYEKGLLTADIARAISMDISSRRYTLYEDGSQRIEYINGVLYLNGVQTEATSLHEKIEEMVLRKIHQVQSLYGEIYCDPSRPEQIREMRISHSLNALAAVNTDKTGRIEFLKYFSVRYIGENIRHEQQGYRWRTSKMDNSQFLNIPEDGDDHLMDAINYGAVTHLRRMGIANRIGEN
jgi:phage terminase large subunit